MTLMYTPWMVASGESLGVEATEVNFKPQSQMPKLKDADCMFIEKVLNPRLTLQHCRTHTHWTLRSCQQHTAKIHSSVKMKLCEKREKQLMEHLSVSPLLIPLAMTQAFSQGR